MEKNHTLLSPGPPLGLPAGVQFAAAVLAQVSTMMLNSSGRPDAPPGPYNYYGSEWYPWYFGNCDLHTMQSVSKGVLAVLYGVVLRQRLLPPVDTPVLALLTDRRVADPDGRKAGINQYYWKLTPSGLADAEGGLYLAPGDIAKVARLYRDGGRWNGRQVVPEDWVRDSLVPATVSTYPGQEVYGQLGYGYQWWVYTDYLGHPGWADTGAATQAKCLPLAMNSIDRLPLQAVVFLVAAAAFSSVYITQPVLPVLADEFGATAFEVSLTVSAVILGIAISILPFGILSDHAPVHRILLAGGLIVATCCLFAALTHSLWTLVAVRFIQGLFIPTLTTCMVTYLARSLPAHKLNVVMGSYVSATVAGGLGGRLLGGWLHPPAHWRYAFVTSAVLIVIATLVAARRLREPAPAVQHSGSETGLWPMLVRPDLLRLFLVAFASFFVFSSVFNFLPFYLAAPPVSLPLQFITALYLTYVIGIVIGPLAGRANNRFGSGLTMAGGALLLALGLLLSLLPSLVAIGLALAAICAGYFGVHASAVGALNLRLSSGRGRANALYVLFYYVGGFSGITVSGFAYAQGGWRAVVMVCIAVLAVPIASGLVEHRTYAPERI